MISFAEHVLTPCGDPKVEKPTHHSSTPKSVIAKEIRATQTGNGNGGIRPYTHASCESSHNLRTYYYVMTLTLTYWCLNLATRWSRDML